MRYERRCGDLKTRTVSRLRNFAIARIPETVERTREIRVAGETLTSPLASCADASVFVRGDRERERLSGLNV